MQGWGSLSGGVGLLKHIASVLKLKVKDVCFEGTYC